MFLFFVEWVCSKCTENENDIWQKWCIGSNLRDLFCLEKNTKFILCVFKIECFIAWILKFLISELVKNENKLLQEEVDHYKTKIRYGIEMRASQRPGPVHRLPSRSKSPRAVPGRGIYTNRVSFVLMCWQILWYGNMTI